MTAKLKNGYQCAHTSSKYGDGLCWKLLGEKKITLYGGKSYNYEEQNPSRKAC